jgi:hypothetical protein
MCAIDSCLGITGHAPDVVVRALLATFEPLAADRKLNMRQTVENIVRAVATAGPVGWIALVACAAMALAAYAISAILTIVHTLR